MRLTESLYPCSILMCWFFLVPHPFFDPSPLYGVLVYSTFVSGVFSWPVWCGLILLDLFFSFQVGITPCILGMPLWMMESLYQQLMLPALLAFPLAVASLVFFHLCVESWMHGEVLDLRCLEISLQYAGVCFVLFAPKLYSMRSALVAERGV